MPPEALSLTLTVFNFLSRKSAASLSKVNKPQPPCAVGACLTQSLWLPPPQVFSDTWPFPSAQTTEIPYNHPLTSHLSSCNFPGTALQRCPLPTEVLPLTPNSAHSSPPLRVLGSSRVPGRTAIHFQGCHSCHAWTQGRPSCPLSAS